MYVYCRYACDLKVVRLMRERGLGNSVSQLYRKLCEQHSEDWATRVLQYLTACEPFVKSSVVLSTVFSQPPQRPPLPKPQWLSLVYARDVLTRLDDVQARITSTYGTILKMDSTKKVRTAAASSACRCVTD